MAAPLIDPTDPHDLTPDQRLEQLTALLGAGVERLLALQIATPLIQSDFSADGLDVSLHKSVHVARPVNAQHVPENGVSR
jgi:hypothetical protein